MEVAESYEGPGWMNSIEYKKYVYFVSPQIDFSGDDRPDAVWAFSNLTFSYCTRDNKITEKRFGPGWPESLDTLAGQELVMFGPKERTQLTRLEDVQMRHTLKVGEVVLQTDDFSAPITIPGKGQFVIWNFDYDSGTPTGTSYKPYWPGTEGPFFWPDKVTLTLLPIETARPAIPLLRKEIIAMEKRSNGGYEYTAEDLQVMDELRQLCGPRAEWPSYTPCQYFAGEITMPAGEVAKLVRAGK